MTYLLDTNQVSKLIDGHPEVVRQIGNVGITHVTTSVVVCGELAFMAQHSKYKGENLDKVLRLFRRILVHPIDIETATLFGEIKEKFIRVYGPKPAKLRAKVKVERLGHRDNDLWIASSAIRHNCVLVSADAHFERIRAVSTLRLEAWWRPSF